MEPIRGSQRKTSETRQSPATLLGSSAGIGYFMVFEGGVRRRDHVEIMREKFVLGIVRQLK
jgi:hypothetical protein